MSSAQGVFVKQKTAYDIRISDWSSDVCSSDLHHRRRDGNTALLLNLHPVGAGAAIGPTRLYLPGQVNRATFQKQFFSERRLTRSEERRVGKGCVRTRRSRWSPSHEPQTKQI